MMNMYKRLGIEIERGIVYVKGTVAVDLTQSTPMRGKEITENQSTWISQQGTTLLENVPMESSRHVGKVVSSCDQSYGVALRIPLKNIIFELSGGFLNLAAPYGGGSYPAAGPQ